MQNAPSLMSDRVVNMPLRIIFLKIINLLCIMDASYCRLSYTKNREMVKSIVGTEFGRSHVSLHSLAGNRLWQLVVWHLYQFLYISLFTMECFCSSLLCYNNLCTKLTQVIKSDTTGFLTIPGQNRKTLKVKRIQAKDN